MVLGLQIITIPWLAVDYLQLSPKSVGLVQCAVLVPNILLILGGLRADSREMGGMLRNHPIFILLAIYGLLHGGLLFLLTQQWLSLFWLLVYAFLLGCTSAFMQPCKDYILGFIASNKLQSLIAKNQCCQYLGQASGIALASQLYLWNINSLPLLQIFLLVLALSCFYCFYRAHHFDSNVEPIQPKAKQNQAIDELLKGFRFCWQSVVLRCLLFIVCVNGFFHIGVFIVALPVLVKTVYAGSVGLYSLLQCLFILGTVTTSLIVIIKGQLDSPGRRVIFSLLYTGLILLGLSAGPTQYGLMFLIFLWGVVVGISATLGRAILQSQASAEYRGRAISLYQFALFGFAPIGSLFAGFAIDHWGVLFVLKLSAYASLAAFVSLFLTRALWKIEACDTESIQ